MPGSSGLFVSPSPLPTPSTDDFTRISLCRLMEKSFNKAEFIQHFPFEKLYMVQHTTAAGRPFMRGYDVLRILVGVIHHGLNKPALVWAYFRPPQDGSPYVKINFHRFDADNRWERRVEYTDPEFQVPGSIKWADAFKVINSDNENGLNELITLTTYLFLRNGVKLPHAVEFTDKFLETFALASKRYALASRSSEPKVLVSPQDVMVSSPGIHLDATSLHSLLLPNRAIFASILKYIPPVDTVQLQVQKDERKAIKHRIEFGRTISFEYPVWLYVEHTSISDRSAKVYLKAKDSNGDLVTFIISEDGRNVTLSPPFHHCKSLRMGKVLAKLICLQTGVWKGDASMNGKAYAKLLLKLGQQYKKSDSAVGNERGSSKFSTIPFSTLPGIEEEEAAATLSMTLKARGPFLDSSSDTSGDNDDLGRAGTTSRYHRPSIAPPPISSHSTTTLSKSSSGRLNMRHALPIARSTTPPTLLDDTAVSTKKLFYGVDTQESALQENEDSMKTAQEDRKEQIKVLKAQVNDAKAQIANMEAALASKKQDLHSKLAKKVELELEYERTAIEEESVIKDLDKLAESKKRLFKDLSAEDKDDAFSKVGKRARRRD